MEDFQGFSFDLLEDGEEENYGDFNILFGNRFQDVTDDDVEHFIVQQQNSNTKKKTASDMKVFHNFLTRCGQAVEPHLLPPEELSKVISRFILSVRKKDGSEFEPSSLRGLFSSIDRHLRQNHYPVSIVTDIQFAQCRDALKSMQKHLKSKGKGNRPQAAEELTDEDIDYLYENGQLGTATPHALINTLWLNNMLYFGMRGGVEQHSLKWGDIQLETEADGRRYLVYTQERQTKTRTGENPKNIRQVKPRAYETPGKPEKDPVRAYIEYSNRRPHGMNNPDDAFFLSINEAKSSSAERVWFKKQNMGINKIYSLMKSMKMKAQLPENKRLTNHNARKHLLQKLNDNNIPPNQIIQISGHRNVNSVNNYCTINNKQQENISNILSNNSSNSLAPVPFSKPTEHLNSFPILSSQVCQPSSTHHKLSSSQYSHADTRALFQGSTFNNSVINVYCHPDNQKSPTQSPPFKYRRILPLQSDSDSN